MEMFIGVDVHASSTTMAVVSGTGKQLRSQVMSTSAEAIIEALKALRCDCTQLPDSSDAAFEHFPSACPRLAP